MFTIKWKFLGKKKKEIPVLLPVHQWIIFIQPGCVTPFKALKIWIRLFNQLESFDLKQ